MVPCMYKYILHLFCPSLTAAWALQRSLHFSSLVLFTIRPKLLWSRTIIFLDYLNVKKHIAEEFHKNYNECFSCSLDPNMYVWLFDCRVRQGKKVLPGISCPILPVAQPPLRNFNVLHIFEIFESSLKI